MERIIVRFGYAIWLAFCLTAFFDVKINEWRFWITIIGLAITMAIKDVYFEPKKEDDDEQ